MISLPRGVADYLAPHPDVEIEPVVANRENKTTSQPNAGTACFRRPARRRARSGPVLFSVISGSAGDGGSQRVR